MVVDANGMPHEPGGSPGGGRYMRKGFHATDGDLEPLIAVASSDMRLQRIEERMSVRSPEETRSLLGEAKHVRFGEHGVELLDADGEVLYRDMPGMPHMDERTMRADRRVQKAVRTVMRADLGELPAASRRAVIRGAFQYANPYARRLAVDASPNRRFLPADTIARSLRHREDQRQAVDVMTRLFYEDANTAANVIRAGYPRDHAAIMTYVNRTKIKRDKDGNAIRGTYVPHRGVNRGREIEGPLPESKGAAARSYLLMLDHHTDGVPDEREARAMASTLGGVDDPEQQARMFHQLCYGRGDTAPAVEGRSRGARLLAAYAGRAGGQGNAARMVAYNRGLSHDGAVAFLAMTPGDGRRANTAFTRRKRVHGVMRNVTPARLTEMRSYIHAVYQVSNEEVDAWRKAHAPAVDE